MSKWNIPAVSVWHPGGNTNNRTAQRLGSSTQINLNGTNSGSVLNHTRIVYGDRGGIASTYANVHMFSGDSSTVMGGRTTGTSGLEVR